MLNTNEAYDQLSSTNVDDVFDLALKILDLAKIKNQNNISALKPLSQIQDLRQLVSYFMSLQQINALSQTNFDTLIAHPDYGSDFISNIQLLNHANLATPENINQLTTHIQYGGSIYGCIINLHDRRPLTQNSFERLMEHAKFAKGLRDGLQILFMKNLITPKNVDTLFRQSRSSNYIHFIAGMDIFKAIDQDIFDDYVASCRDISDPYQILTWQPHSEFTIAKSMKSDYHRSFSNCVKVCEAFSGSMDADTIGIAVFNVPELLSKILYLASSCNIDMKTWFDIYIAIADHVQAERTVDSEILSIPQANFAAG